MEAVQNRLDRLNRKTYLTKIWTGRHWWYVDTSRSYTASFRLFGRWNGAVSYKKSKEVF